MESHMVPHMEIETVIEIYKKVSLILVGCLDMFGESL